MTPRSPSRTKLRVGLTLAWAGLSLAGCATGRGQTVSTGLPAVTVPAAVGSRARLTPPAPTRLLPSLPGRPRAFVAVSAGGNVAGEVKMEVIGTTSLQDNAAPYRLAATPAGRALVTLGTLSEDLFTVSGSVVTATTDASGAFALTGARPTGRPYVVSAQLAGGHRLTAIAPSDAASVTVDEGTTCVTELARWQLREGPEAGRLDLTDVPAATWANLGTWSRTLLTDVTAPLVLPDTGTGGRVHIAALQRGAGHALRNAYVEHFGSRVTTGPTTSTPPQANLLSDAWLGVLGFRPLALTRVAGNGIPGYDQSTNRPALDVPLSSPRDVAVDHLGNVWFTQGDSHLISIVPRFALPGGVFGAAGPLLANHIYTVLGVVNGPPDAISWEFDYVNLGGTEPPVGGGGAPLFFPDRLALEPSTGAGSHVYFTAPLTCRVMLVPDAAMTRYGRSMDAAKLYTVAGSGLPPADPTAIPDWIATHGDPATQAGLWAPTGLVRDADNNLWILDAGFDPGTGGLWVVRASDGLIFQVPLRQNGQPFTPDGAQDLVLSPSGAELYVADTARHWVFKLPRPSGTTISGFNATTARPAPVEIERVTGKAGRAGYVDLQVAGVDFPPLEDVSRGVLDPAGDLTADGGAVASTSVTALLDSPSAVAFDGQQRLIVADTGNGRLRLLNQGSIYTIAGGLDTRYVTGDARLAYMPGISGLFYSAFDGTLLLTDQREVVVRRLHTQRGILE